MIILLGDWGLGIGDWGLGIGDWGLGPIPNPQSPIPNPQSPIPKVKVLPKYFLYKYYYLYYEILNKYFKNKNVNEAFIRYRILFSNRIFNLFFIHNFYSILFSAKKYKSNGISNNITYVVF